MATKKQSNAVQKSNRKGTQADKKAREDAPSKEEKSASKKGPDSRTAQSEQDVSGYTTKQSFVKIAKSKSKANPRTWVLIYRLVDGPPIEKE